MARFYVEVEGEDSGEIPDGPVWVTGNEETGLSLHVRGWNIGVEVTLRPHRNDKGLDTITITETGGSYNPDKGIHLGYLEAPTDPSAE